LIRLVRLVYVLDLPRIVVTLVMIFGVEIGMLAGVGEPANSPKANYIQLGSPASPWTSVSH